MMFDGVRMDHVRRCSCGRVPVVSTAYPGWEAGEGPFVIKCYCDRDPDEMEADGLPPLPVFFSRSWSKTRAVRNWSALHKRERD